MPESGKSVLEKVIEEVAGWIAAGLMWAVVLLGSAVVAGWAVRAFRWGAGL